MRISDWRSDVCSSDLCTQTNPAPAAPPPSSYLLMESILPARARSQSLIPGPPAHKRRTFFPASPGTARPPTRRLFPRSEEHTSELQSLMRISYAVFCLKKNKNTQRLPYQNT